MSTIAPATIAAAGSHPGARRLPIARLATVILAHGVIDWLSAIIIPILSYLEGRVEMSQAQGAILIAIGSISSGLIQPLVAILSDKHNTRWAGTAGLIAASIAIGCVGFAQDYTHLVLIQIIGAGGIGAFHPVGASAAGQLGGKARSSAISIFYVTGVSGGVLGGFSAPQIAEHLGLKSLAWTIPPFLLFAALLAWAIHSIPHKQAGAQEHHDSLPKAEQRRRWRDVGLLFGANVFRFLVNMMLVILLVRWSEAQVLLGTTGGLTKELRLDSTHLNGPLYSMMAIGMGASGLTLGWFVPIAKAKRFLIGMPLLGAAAIVIFPRLESMGVPIHEPGFGKAMVWFMAAMMGMGYAAVMPLTITMAQRLLPHRTSLASALMMGGAWSVAFIGPPMAQWMLRRGLSLQGCFTVTAGLLLMSSLMATPMGKAPEDGK